MEFPYRNIFFFFFKTETNKKKKAHQVDNLDRYALTTLTVSRSWSFSPQLQYLQRRYSVQVLENVPVDTIILAMAINKPIDQVWRWWNPKGARQLRDCIVQWS